VCTPISFQAAALKLLSKTKYSTAICDRELTDFVNFQWKENQTRLGMQGSLVMTAIKQQLDVIMSAQQKAPETKCIESLFTKLSGSFDETHGGFGGAPRFPQPSMFFKPDLHYQSFCDHSRSFAKVNSKF
jgi:uncharacterized protein YyaL (SSP411 family)